jgi:hypothetical protein
MLLSSSAHALVRVPVHERSRGDRDCVAHETNILPAEEITRPRTGCQRRRRRHRGRLSVTLEFAAPRQLHTTVRPLGNVLTNKLPLPATQVVQHASARGVDIRNTGFEHDSNIPCANVDSRIPNCRFSSL